MRRHRSRLKRFALPLPLPPTVTVGRDTEIACVTGLVADEKSRLVTITGPGGVGKTRLAVEVARRVEGRFADGARFVSLAGVASSENVASTIAGALPIVPARGESIENALSLHVPSRELLLVLDNFEHLLEAAPIVADLLAAGPRLTVLATSREPLRLRGEYLFSLAPLALPNEADAPGRVRSTTAGRGCRGPGWPCTAGR